MTEPKSADEKKKEVRLEREIELAAPIEEVWKALTDGKELARWFPLEARVTPGVGGKVFLSWGPGFEGESEIVAWEPPRRLAGKDQFAFVEWTLESRGGKTLLRLVQSGFLTGADWEQEWYDSTSYGWLFMLLGLQVALERHPGVPRQVVWLRQKASISREDAFNKLLSAGALFREELRGALTAGEPYSLTTLFGETYTGRVEFLRANRGLCVSVRELNDALLWLTIEGTPDNLEVQLWLSAFAVEPARVRAFESYWAERLRGTFPS
jgi:uncharacterized protein YndB with AHSA1/START domain